MSYSPPLESDLRFIHLNGRRIGYNSVEAVLGGASLGVFLLVSTLNSRFHFMILVTTSNMQRRAAQANDYRSPVFETIPLLLKNWQNSNNYNKGHNDKNNKWPKSATHGPTITPTTSTYADNVLFPYNIGLLLLVGRHIGLHYVDFYRQH